jgi:hypothetical protein
LTAVILIITVIYKKVRTSATGTRGSKRVLPPRKQCELEDTELQELEFFGQDSFIAVDNTKVLIPPIFQGLTIVCMLMSYI